MKKIVNEWRSFVNETKPKHPPKPNPRSKYDRAQTAQVQSTTEGPMELIRHLLSQYMLPVSSYNVGHHKNFEGVIYHINELEPSLRNKILEDLKTLMYIYTRPIGGIIKVGNQDVNTDSYIDLFNDRKSVAIVDKLKTIMIEFNLPSLSFGEKPSPQDIERVFKFYVMPYNFSSLYPEPEPTPEAPTDFMKDMFGSMFKDPEPKPSRFSSQLGTSAKELERRNYELWLKSIRGKNDK